MNIFQSIYHRLGDIFGRLQQWSEAERFHRAALEAQPDHIAAHISYGTMLAKNVSFFLLKTLLTSTAGIWGSSIN